MTAKNAKPAAAGAAPAPPVPAPSDTASYTVVSPLNHDLVDCAVGSTVQLTEGQAKPLLGHTVVAVATPADE